jgi:hypothetical protein
MVDVLQGGESEMSLEGVIPKLQLVEHRMAASVSEMLSTDTARAYYAGARKAGVCWNCQKPGHVKRNCPALKRNKYEIAMGAQVVREIAF